MAKRFKLKDLLTHGLLKPNEEIYMDYRGLHFTARVLADGSFQTDKGIFKSTSHPTFLNIMEDEKYREWFYEYFGISKDTPYHWTRIEEVKKLATIKKPHIVGGWYLWKTWNGTSLDELRKKINPTKLGRSIEIWQNFSDRLGVIRFYWALESEASESSRKNSLNYFKIILPNSQSKKEEVENLMQLNFMVLDKNDQDCKEKFLASNEIGFSEIIEANKYLAKVITLESLLRFAKKRANKLSEI